MSREQFEKWADEERLQGLERAAACDAWLTRQSEIDALKTDNKHLSDNLDSVGRESITLEEENYFLEGEIEKLKAEVAQLRNSSLDTEAIAWAAQKLQAFGLDYCGMDNAMMLDRLYAMLHGPVIDAAMKETK